MIVSLIIADDDSAASKSRRLRLVRKVNARTKADIALCDRAIATLERQRARRLTLETLS